jgi:acylphosphatase
MSAHERIARKVVVRGRVQGVYYRDRCRREALAAGVSGWVRNELDGSVQALVEGPAAAVDRLVAWMRIGPRRAIVEDIEVTVCEPEGLTGFHVG